MTTTTREGGDLRITRADGTTVLLLELYRDDDPTTVSGTLAPADRTQTRSVRRIYKDLSLGMGWSRKMAGDPDGQVGGYAYAENAITRFSGGVVPSGAYGTMDALTSAYGQPVQLVVYDGHVWAICTTGIAYVVDGTAAVLSFGTYIDVSGTGDYYWGATVYDNQLYVGRSCVHSTHGLTRFDSSATVTLDTDVFRRQPVTVYWVVDAVGGYRMVAPDATNTHKLRYTISGASDPMDTASWASTQLPVGGSEYAIERLVASDTTVWAIKKDGIYSINEQGWARNLTPYWRQMIHPNNGAAAMLYGGGIVASHGTGLDFVRLGRDGQAAPVWIDPAQTGFNETPVNGRVTALCNDGRWLVAAIYDGTDTYICYGEPNTRGGGPPFIWHGAEHVITGQKVVSMLVYTDPGAANPPRLWLLGWNGSIPTVAYVSVPGASSPLAQWGTDPTAFPFRTAYSLYFSEDEWDDPAARKVPIHGQVLSQNLADTRSLQVLARSNGDGSYSEIETLTASPSSEFDFDTDGAYSFGWRVDGAGDVNNPAILRSLAIEANVSKEQTLERTYRVVIGRTLRSGAPDHADTEATYGQIREIAEDGERVTLVDPMGNEQLVAIDPNLPEQLIEQRVGGETGWVRVLTMRVSTLHDYAHYDEDYYDTAAEYS